MHFGKLVILSALACLSVGSGCVDLEKPAVVQDCARNHQCVNTPTGSGGVESAGGGVGSGGEMTGGAGGSAGGNAGAVAGNSGSSGASGGATGGAGPGTGGGGATGRADGGGGAVGSGGAMDGGTADRPDLPAEPRDGTDIDARVEAGSFEDTNSSAPETPQDVAQAEAGSGRDVEPDGPPDGPSQALDVSPDLLDVLSGEPISCIQEFQSNGYAVTAKTDSAILACSDCKVNGISKEAPCKIMIDCLRAAWPCKREAACWTSCQNSSGEDMALGSCVSTLVSEACPGS
jgi:hypothetical protein